MYRSYYSYSDMPQMIRKEEKNCEEKNTSCTPCGSNQNNKILGSLEADDIILGVIILALLSDDGGDNLLLIVLAIIFLTGIT